MKNTRTTLTNEEIAQMEAFIQEHPATDPQSKKLFYYLFLHKQHGQLSPKRLSMATNILKRDEKAKKVAEYHADQPKTMPESDPSACSELPIQEQGETV